MTAPAQLLSLALAAPAEAVWLRLQHSAFLASYLSAGLPPARWAAGQTLAGRRADGAALRITLLSAQAPAQMTFVMQHPAGPQRLLLSLEPSGAGSRLTVLHGQPGEVGTWGNPLLPGPSAANALAPAAPAAPSLAALLAAAPSPPLLSGRPGSFDHPGARQQALAYLANTAALVAALRQQMPDRQGYAQAGAGSFSLAQHLWHLADVEEFGWASRFQRLLDEAAPVLPGVDGDRLARERRYQQRPWRAAARRFEAQRRLTLRALARCDATVLQRPVHFSGQASTGTEMVAALLAHDHEHRGEMAALWPPTTAPRRAEPGRPRRPPQSNAQEAP